MKTVAQIQKRMSAFDEYARTHTKSENLCEKWRELFGTELNKKSADAFVSYYRKMKQNKGTRKQRGGVVGAPLNYTMTPGVNVSVYGRFPVPIDDPSQGGAAMVKDLDVFFANALTKDCGNLNQAESFPHPSSEMGSNQVGGRRNKSRKERRHRKTERRNRKNRRATYRRKQNGAGILTTLGYHPYLDTAPPNYLQIGAHDFNGVVRPLPFPAAPTNHQWNYVSSGTAGVIDPGIVTPIGTEFKTFASLDPYQINV